MEDLERLEVASKGACCKDYSQRRPINITVEAPSLAQKAAKKVFRLRNNHVRGLAENRLARTREATSSLGAKTQAILGEKNT